MSKNKINISRGLTFEGGISFLGFFILFFFGCGLFYLDEEKGLLILIFILLAFFGLMLFLSIKGIIIDVRKKRIKPYIHFLFFKLGRWKPINNAQRIVLEYINRSQTLGNRSTSTRLETKIYTVSLRYSSKEKVLLKEFLDYENAKAFLDQYAELFEIEKKDCYKIMLDEIAKRKMKR